MSSIGPCASLEARERAREFVAGEPAAVHRDDLHAIGDAGVERRHPRPGIVDRAVRGDVDAERAVAR